MTAKSKSKRHKLKLHVRTGDTVMVIAGDEKGKKGIVLQVFPDKMRAIVEDVNLVYKHVKATAEQEGGIEQIPAPIHVSNLALVDPKTGEPTRIGRRLENGKWVRYSKKTGNLIE